ncbi:DUF6624 domain-containing protein [Brevundimonas sp.]|uniref:DUF6624 domain-containing protein n=1 Tax=Brevundimonas sp. TaxID=1871086 RepID=UPI0035B4AE3D
MLSLIAAAWLGFQPAHAMSPEIAEVIAPVTEAIAAERDRQAALPPPADDREQLERMGALDQAPRMRIGEIDVSRLSPEQAAEAWAAVGAAIKPIDEANLSALLTMVPDEGWFTRSRYGSEAASAAFHIVQHGDETVWRRFLPVLEPLVATGEVEGEAYAMMFDRLAVSEERPQRYGTQFICVDRRMTLAPLEDEDRVEAWRAEMNISLPLSAYVDHMKAAPPCG